MTKVFNRNFWLTLVALALSENKRNIRSFFIVLYKYTCICAYSKCEDPHLYIFWCTSLIWRRIFALSPLGREKIQIRRHQDCCNDKLKDFDISFASLPLHLYMSPSYLRTFAPSSSQLRTFPFTTSYSCIFNLEEKVQVALSEHRNVSVLTLDKTRFKIHSTANMIL